jgi:hypothetical protein
MRSLAFMGQTLYAGIGDYHDSQQGATNNAQVASSTDPSNSSSWVEDSNFIAAMSDANGKHLFQVTRWRWPTSGARKSYWLAWWTSTPPACG